MFSFRQRKSPFVKLFDKTPDGVRCPHFYELVLSNGCPFNCRYCYLNLTFRGRKSPVLFTNDWSEVESQLERVPEGVFSTGELADSLAMIPPLLPTAIAYFASQTTRYLLLVTKSINVGLLQEMEPSPQVIVSFSVNSPVAAQRFELGCPSPSQRLAAAERLKERGYRVRIRLDPMIYEIGIEDYRELCKRIASLDPERVTIGTLRQYPGLHRFARDAPRQGLRKASDGRMRYPLDLRIRMYEQVADWLGLQPALCKETDEVWQKLGWRFEGCNCTP